MGDRALNFVEVRAWCRALGMPWVEFTTQMEALLAGLDGNDEGKQP